MAHTLSDNARNLLNTMRQNGTVDVTSKVNISISNESPLVGGNITISWTVDGTPLNNLVLSINGKVCQTDLGNRRSLSLPIQNDEKFTIQLSSDSVLSEAVVITPLAKVSLMNKNVLKKLANKLMVFSALLFIGICITKPLIVGLIFGVVAPFLFAYNKVYPWQLSILIPLNIDMLSLYPRGVFELFCWSVLMAFMIFVVVLMFDLYLVLQRNIKDCQRPDYWVLSILVFVWGMIIPNAIIQNLFHNGAGLGF
jgi:hypothetical protein